MKLFDLLKKLTLTGTQCVYCKKEIPDGNTACESCEKQAEKLRNKVLSKDEVLYAFQYGGVIRNLVHAYKYGDMPRYATLIAQFMYEYLEKHYPDLEVDFITYVPVHKNRKRQRGYDQAELLATYLSIMLKKPIKTLLERKIDTMPQYELSAAAREKNIEGAFVKKEDSAEVRGKNILLVDDIYTTGSTIRECTKQLKGATVIPLAFARE